MPVTFYILGWYAAVYLYMSRSKSLQELLKFAEDKAVKDGMLTHRGLVLFLIWILSPVILVEWVLHGIVIWLRLLPIHIKLWLARRRVNKLSRQLVDNLKSQNTQDNQL